MSDDYSTDDDAEIPVVHVTSKPKSGSSPRKGSARVKKAKKSGTKGANSAREAWIKSVNSGEYLTRSKSPMPSAKGKLPQEYWSDTLRKTGTGFHHAPKNSTTGLSPEQTKFMAYDSTSHFLRQQYGFEKPSKKDARPAPGTPAYKSPEEYYDEIRDLKKKMKDVKEENAVLKARYKRMEQEHNKKDKEIEKLLNPSTTDEYRRTMADGRQENSSVIHSLKQRILRLEQQIKDKETAYNKLHMDLKTVKIEELKTHKEMYYKEMLRLREIKRGDVMMETASKAQGQTGSTRDVSGSLKDLNKIIASVTEKNAQLRNENRKLQDDLEQLLNEHDGGGEPSKEYKNMSRDELLALVGKLERRLAKAEKTAALSSRRSRRDVPSDGKMTLEGNLSDKLDQLDKRETQLLAEITAKDDTIVNLTQDRDHYRKRCDLLEADLKSMKEHGHVTPRTTPPRAPTPKDRRSSSSSTPSRKVSRAVSSTEVERFRRNHAAKTIQKSWRGHQEREREKLQEQEFEKRLAEFQANRSAKVIQRYWRKHQEDRRSRDKKELERLVRKNLENKAARTIQRGWKGHKETKDDEATEIIQAAIRGHQSRKQQLSRYKDDDDASDTVSIASSDAAMVVQAAVRGHRARTEGLNEKPRNSKNTGLLGRNRRDLDSEAEDVDVNIEEDLNTDSDLSLLSTTIGSKSKRPGAAVSRPKSSVLSSRSSFSGSSKKATKSMVLDDDDDDEDDSSLDLGISASKSKRPGAAVSGTKSSVLSSRSNTSGSSKKPTKAMVSDDDDEDDSSLDLGTKSRFTKKKLF